DLRRRALGLQREYLGHGAEQVLDVVAHLVRDDVRLRELAGRAEALRQLAVEAEVDIGALVGAAIEGAHRRRRRAAARGGLVPEEDQLGVAVLLRAREELPPGPLRVVERADGHALQLFLGGGARGAGRTRGLAAGGGARALLPGQPRGIVLEDEGDDEDHHHHGHGAAQAELDRGRDGPAVLDVAAVFVGIAQAHARSVEPVKAATQPRRAGPANRLARDL